METTSAGKEDVLTLTNDLNRNIDAIAEYFADNDTFISRIIESKKQPNMRFCLLYSDGMTDNRLVNEDVIQPLLALELTNPQQNILVFLSRQGTFANEVKISNDLEEILQAILYGDTVLLPDHCDRVLILNTKGWQTRSIAEPEAERVLKGPREGFNESLNVNLSLIRRRLVTPDLKMKYMSFGTRTKTKACVCYLDSIVNKDVLSELMKRLNKIEIDGVLDSNYLVELIKDSPYSTLKTIGNTERPDVVTAKLLEGRVAVLVDGTPVAITLPYLFIENIQSNEDYYVNFYFSSFDRLLRMVSLVATTSIPAIYLSLTTFHQEMLPSPLMLSISSARQGVPFPTVIELIVMVIIFDILREAGSRIPGVMGQTLSIVGALVIGQSAVEARLVSAPIIIIVALTGITSIMVPRLNSFVITMRIIFLLCAAFLGIYGYLFGLFTALLHILNLNSFNIPIVTLAYSVNFQDRKDVYIRSPWPLMLTRPKMLSPNRIRQKVTDKTRKEL